MAELFLPTLHTFAMNNIFTGSKGLFRFRAEPKVVMANPKEVDFAQSAIHVEYWHGLYCYEKSTMEGECTFPMSEEGREEMRRWLEENESDSENLCGIGSRRFRRFSVSRTDNLTFSGKPPEKMGNEP